MCYYQLNNLHRTTYIWSSDENSRRIDIFVNIGKQILETSILNVANINFKRKCMDIYYDHNWYNFKGAAYSIIARWLLWVLFEFKILYLQHFKWKPDMVKFFKSKLDNIWWECYKRRCQVKKFGLEVVIPNIYLNVFVCLNRYHQSI